MLQIGNTEIEMPIGNREKNLRIKLKVVGSKEKLKRLEKRATTYLPQNIKISDSIFKNVKDIHQEPKAVSELSKSIEEIKKKVVNTDYLYMDYFVSIETFLDRLLVETNKNKIKNHAQDFSRETSSIDEMLDNIKSGAPFAAILNIHELSEDLKSKTQRNVFDVAERIPVRIPNEIARAYNKNNTLEADVCFVKLEETSSISLFKIHSNQLKEEKIVNIKNQEVFLPFLDAYKSKRSCMFKVLYDTLSILVYTNPNYPDLIYISFFSHAELKSVGLNKFIEINANILSFLYPDLELVRNRSAYEKFSDRITNLHAFLGRKYFDKYLNFRENQELNGKLINKVYNYYKDPNAFENFMNSCENYLIVDGIAKVYFRKDISNGLKEEMLKTPGANHTRTLLENIEYQVKKAREFKSIHAIISDGKKILDNQQFMSIIEERERDYIRSLPPEYVSYLTAADLNKKKINLQDRYTFSPYSLEKVMLFSFKESFTHLISNIKREPIDPVTLNRRSSKTVFYNPDMAYKINNDQRVLEARKKEVEYMESLNKYRRPQSFGELIQIYDEIFDLERSIYALYDTIKTCIGQIMSKVNKQTHLDEKIKVTTEIFEDYKRGLNEEERSSAIKALVRIVDLRFRAKEIVQDETEESNLESILECRRIIDDIEKEYAGYRTCVFTSYTSYSSDIRNNSKYFWFGSFNCKLKHRCLDNCEIVPARFCWSPKNNMFFAQANMMRDLVFPVMFISTNQVFTLYKNEGDLVGYVNFTFKGGKDYYLFIEEKTKRTYSFKGNRVFLDCCVADVKKWYLTEFEAMYYGYSGLHYYEVLDFNERLGYSEEEEKELRELQNKYETQCILISKYDLQDIKKKYKEYDLDPKELEKLKEVIPKKTERGSWIFKKGP